MFGSLLGVPPAIVPLLSKLGEYGQQAILWAAEQKASGVDPNPDTLATELEQSMVEWNPTLKGRPLADPPTRRAAARFLAGIAVNLTKPAQTTKK